MSQDPATRRENASLTRRLLLFTAGSFAFGFALVPLYDVICEAAGIRVNEAPSRMGESAAADRKVALEFVVDRGAGRRVGADSGTEGNRRAARPAARGEVRRSAAAPRYP